MNRLEKLEVWIQTRELRIIIAQTVKSFPPEEKFRLVDQMIRSSRSAPANIAEGYGRYHFQESIQFCRQARGSLFETLEHVHCAQDDGYINAMTFNTLSDKINTCIRITNGYIEYLKNQKENQSRAQEPDNIDYSLPPPT